MQNLKWPDIDDEEDLIQEIEECILVERPQVILQDYNKGVLTERIAK